MQHRQEGWASSFECDTPWERSAVRGLQFLVGKAMMTNNVRSSVSCSSRMLLDFGYRRVKKLV